MSIQEYDRRWDLIMRAWEDGYFTLDEASAAVAELTAQRTRRIH